MTEMVKIRGESRALFLAAQRFSKEAVQQSTNWSPETLGQGTEGFIEPSDCEGGKALNGPHAPFPNSLAEQKMDLCLNTAPILEYYTQQRKNAPFIVSFFFFVLLQLFMGSL